jgi:hypothetical protein
LTVPLLEISATLLPLGGCTVESVMEEPHQREQDPAPKTAKQQVDRPPPLWAAARTPPIFLAVFFLLLAFWIVTSSFPLPTQSVVLPDQKPPNTFQPIFNPPEHTMSSTEQT